MVVINNKKTAGRQRISTRKTALFGLLTALAVVLGYVESLIPVYLGAPGVKLGLANLVTMIALYCMGRQLSLTWSVSFFLVSHSALHRPSCSAWQEQA
mgnify:CR=1 FL=1